MANQPTKYRKFLVGAASAALVASAVAPVASAATPELSDVKGNTHAEGINALLAAGVINGYPDGTFLPNKTLTRSDVVKMMGKWLVSLDHKVPTDYKTVQRFSDLPLTANDELLQYAALVKDKGVFQGSDGKLLASDDITRENMALVLVRAFDTIHDVNLVEFVKEQTFKKDVTDLATAKAEAQPAIDVLDYFDITNPVAPQFNPKSTTTRGQFASFLYKTTKVDPAAVDLKIDSVDSVKAITTTVDNTTRGQVLELAINKNERKVTVAQLEKAGFEVEFQSLSDVFDTSAGYTSSTGILNGQKLQEIYSSTPNKGERNFVYTVVVTDKDGVQVESNRQEVSILDVALGAVSIDGYSIEKSDGVVLKSSILVLGEDYDLTDISATLPGNVKVDNLPEHEDYHVEYESSNTNAVVVDNTGKLIPVGTGKATITVKSGAATKAINLEVKAEKRVASKVTLAETTAKISTAATEDYSVGVTVTDQYGDPVKDEDFELLVGTLTGEDVLNSKGLSIAQVTGLSSSLTDVDGATKILIDAASGNVAGEGTIQLNRNGSSVKLAALKVQTADVGYLADTYKLSGNLNLKLDGGSKNLKLNGFKNGYFVGEGVNDAAGTGKVTVEFRTSNTKVVTASTTDDINATVVPVGVGKATVEAYSQNAAGAFVRLTGVTYTVAGYGTSVAGSTFHSLAITSSTNTPLSLDKEIINKLILTSGKAYAYKNEQVTSDGTATLDIVVDEGTADEKVVGQVRVTSTVRDVSNNHVGVKFEDNTGEFTLEADTADGKFGLNTKGSLIVRIHSGDQVDSPTVASTTISVNIK